MKALDLFCAAGGISVGLARVGFDVTGVDSDPKVERYWRRGMEPYGGEFLYADALEVPLGGYDLIHASPPCQAYTALRHLCKGKVYPDLVDAVRDRLVASGVFWCIENVEGAPLAVPPGGSLALLCGTMFGLQTPDGRAEIRRHRLFETSFPIVLRPACQHGYAPQVLTVTGEHPRDDGAQRRRRALAVAGHGARAWNRGSAPTLRETFPIEDARAAMQIDWMPMKYLSQAIPPAYASWIGRQARAFLQAEPAVTLSYAGGGKQ